MDKEVEIGQIVRYIIESHKKGIRSIRRNISSEFKISKTDYPSTIQKVAEKFEELGITLVGIDCMVPQSYVNAEKYFLVKNNNEHVKKIKVEINDFDLKLMILIFTIIFTEGDHVGHPRLIKILSKSEKLKNYDLIGFINTMKRKGYLNITKIDEELIVDFNWRFYVEFPNFNPIKIMDEIEADNKENHTFN
ncbi:hypothetical protein SLOPH_2474 [Spraguea lophii 42_110]|uniref:MAGE domain-containing protein n=1 Tax=Spraguea lophii (strain 42_110) TaxID=1358809 RepID=S7W658_SPRLO|nr:hypothetical protein SLOPH_2474 [Spraguea lophii 42_110]